MRVLFVARWYPSHDSPGRGSFVADQVRALTRRGIEIVVASWELALLSAAETADAESARLGRAAGRLNVPLATPRSWGAGVPVARLSTIIPSDPAARHPVDLGTWQAATLVPFAEALSAVWPIDLIHAHTGLPDGHAAAAAAERIGVPLLTTEHDGSLDQRLTDERARAAYRELVGEGRRLVAVSSRLAGQMADLAGISRPAIEVIPNLVDLALFAPDPTVRRDPTELLWVGNRKASKGMVELLHAFTRVAVGRPELHLRLIGAAPTAVEDERLRDLADHLEIGARVSFEAPTSRREVAAAMARAGLFVHPSPTESFGIVAVEALAAGLPVVAVAPTVIDHIGRDGTLGEAATGPDSGSLADAIERALARLGDFNPARLVAAARPYGEGAVADRLMQAYRDALGQSPPRGWADRSPRPPPAWSVPPAGALVVATRRPSALERVGRLSPAAAANLTIVTAVATAARAADPAPPPPRVRRWVEVDVELAFRRGMARLGPPPGSQPAEGRAGRWIRAALHPRRTLARRHLVRHRSEMAQAAWTAAVTAATAELAPGTPVMGLDGDDLPVIERAGLLDRLVPVGLRWVADRHDEATP